MTAPHLFSWTPDAVVFDCDGTLMDTECHWQEARTLALRDYGLTPEPGFAERAKGLHFAACGRLMAREAGRPAWGSAMTDSLLGHFRRLVAGDSVMMPGARELVAAAGRFAPLAVASNCPAQVVEDSLRAAGVLRFFAHVVVPGDGVRPKPEPDIYLTAARLCGVNPCDALAVEDSHCGVQAAVSAGLRVLGAGACPRQETKELADLWVTSLGEPAVRGWARARVPSQTTRRAAGTEPSRTSRTSPSRTELP